MTTHDQHTEQSDFSDEAQPVTGGAQPVTEHTAPTVHADPSTAPTESSLPQSESPPVSDQRNQSPSSVVPPDPSSATAVSGHRGAGRTHGGACRGRLTNHQLSGHCSSRTSSRDCGRVGTLFRRGSSTIPRSASRRRMAWCPIWSNNSRRVSPLRVRGSRSSGLAARRRPPRISGSRCSIIASSSSGCLRCNTENSCPAVRFVGQGDCCRSLNSKHRRPSAVAAMLHDIVSASYRLTERISDHRVKSPYSYW